MRVRVDNKFTQRHHSVRTRLFQTGCAARKTTYGGIPLETCGSRTSMLITVRLLDAHGVSHLKNVRLPFNLLRRCLGGYVVAGGLTSGWPQRLIERRQLRVSTIRSLIESEIVQFAADRMSHGGILQTRAASFYPATALGGMRTQ
jgi:hypothetical protein